MNEEFNQFFNMFSTEPEQVLSTQKTLFYDHNVQALLWIFGG
jgi:hypothetical protein